MMQQQAIEIPTPSRADNETVITALETAAIFGSKGDGREAMRWLRRAAESAGEAGDDERALSLSRAAADLNEELDAAPAPEQKAPPLPAPPSVRALPRPSSSPRASHPPPPSSRAARPVSSSPRPSQAPRPSSRPSYTGARQPLSVVPPVNGSSTSAARSEPAHVPTPPPLPLAPALSSAPPALPVEPARLSVAPAPSVEPARLSAPPALPVEPARLSTPPALPVEPAVRVSSPSAMPAEPVRPALPATGARHAARVAVAISTTKPGVLELRLLADGETARIGSSEAMLVMLDPASTLLSR